MKDLMICDHEKYNTHKSIKYVICLKSLYTKGQSSFTKTENTSAYYII